MKYFFLFLFFVWSLALFAQTKVSDSSFYYSTFFENEVEIESQNWVKDSLEFSSGHYYWFVGKVNRGKIVENLTLKYPHPMLILGFLLGQKIDVEEAWHRPFASSCGVLHVIV